jgi:hypothetical protein
LRQLRELVAVASGPDYLLLSRSSDNTSKPNRSCLGQPAHQGAAQFVHLFFRRQTLEKPNFNFQKRQKELAKQKKNEEKRQRKLHKNAMKPAEDRQQPTGSEDSKNGV